MRYISANPDILRPWDTGAAILKSEAQTQPSECVLLGYRPGKNKRKTTSSQKGLLFPPMSWGVAQVAELLLCTKRRICSPELCKLGMAVQAYTHSTQEAETKGPEGEALLS